jgi:hypothetical protein
MSYRHDTQTRDEVVVDLSRLVNQLLDYQDLSDLLTEEEEKKLVDYIRAMLDMSHDRIRHRYSSWQEADRAHDVYVPPDTTRFREKAVISDTRAIADTVLTYMMAAVTGRNPMFQLEGLDRKSRKAAAIFERLLHQHMRRTAGEAKLAQLFLDSIRYGLSPTKLVWNPKSNTNQMINYDPRRYFPDPRVPWGDWEHQQFHAFVDFYSTNALLGTNMYPKLRKYPGLRKSCKNTPSWEAHQYIKEAGRGLSVDPADPTKTGYSSYTLDPARVVDEVWFKLNGYEVNLPQIEQLWLTATIIDEDVVIRFQLSPYGQQFPVIPSSLFFDRHKTFGQSLYDLLLPLHDIATWLLRSRIDNVQAALNNLIFADPTQVSIADLVDRNPWGIVRTLPGSKPGDGVFIAEVPDVTRTHWNDIAALSDLKQRVSAASDAQQGMPTSDGIRTATEIQRLTQLGSQRLGVLSRIISATSIRPLVHMMVSNIQDSIAYNGSIRLDRDESAGILADMVQDNYLDFDIHDLQGHIEYLVVDGTLPIEPTRSPETWINILQLVNNSGLQMEYKAGKMVEEAIRSMGISDLDSFKYTPEEIQKQQGQPLPHQQLALLEKMRGASVRPEENIHREVERGNLVPLRSAA